jgi:hypothetical protein
VSWPDFKWCRFYCELPSPTWTNGESTGRELEHWTVPLTEGPILNLRKTKGLNVEKKKKNNEGSFRIFAQTHGFIIHLTLNFCMRIY